MQESTPSLLRIGIPHLIIWVPPPPQSKVMKFLLLQVTKEGRSISDKIGWFFFDLLLLGYVEDPPTGLSFSFSLDTSWNLYIEV